MKNTQKYMKKANFAAVVIAFILQVDCVYVKHAFSASNSFPSKMLFCDNMLMKLLKRRL